MKLEGETAFRRIFLDTFQKRHHCPVYEAIVMQARRKQLAGAAVLIGLEGFGQNGVMLKQHPWRLANDRTVQIEMVDTSQKVEVFLASIEPMLQNAIVTLERAHVICYCHRKENAP